MKVVFSGLITNAKGKIGDQVFSRNHYGTFVRAYYKTPASGSAYWHTIRDYGITLSQAWSTLSDAERKAWNESAKFFKRSDSLGQPYCQSGMNFFVGSNINILMCGGVMRTLPADPEAVGNFNMLSLNADSSTPAKYLLFEPAILYPCYVKLFITAPMSAGINRAFRQFRCLTVMDYNYYSGIDIESEYVARFGVSGSAGEKIFIKAICVSVTSGLQGRPIYAQSIIY